MNANKNTKLTRTQNDIKEMITERYDYISKFDALKFVAEASGHSCEIKDMVAAYNSIGW